MTGDLLGNDEGSLRQLVSIEQDLDSNYINQSLGNNKISMDFEILEANESMEESTVIGEQSSYREKHLKMSKQNSGE